MIQQRRQRRRTRRHRSPIPDVMVLQIWGLTVQCDLPLLLGLGVVIVGVVLAWGLVMRGDVFIPSF